MEAIAYFLTIIFLAAIVGVIKPYFQTFLSRKKFAIIAAVSFVLIGVVAPKSELTGGASGVPQDDRTTETDEASPSGYAGSLANLATRADFNAQELKWPLTVDQARLGCTNNSRWAEVDGVKYALNGRARGQGYEPVEAIWRVDEAMTQLIREELENRGVSSANEPPVRVDIGDMIAEAGKLCR